MGNSKTTDQKVIEKLSYPYGNSIGSKFNDKQIDALENSKNNLKGLTYDEACEVIELLKEQIRHMSIVSYPSNMLNISSTD